MGKLAVGSEFLSFDALLAAIKQYEDRSQTTYWRRDSRTLTNARKRGVNIPENSNIMFHSLTFACNFGGRNYKSKSSGKRPFQQTYRTGCKACVVVRASKDAQKLVVHKLMEEHSHTLNKESYQYLPKCRKLLESEKNEVSKILKTKPNNKLLQQHIKHAYGKRVTLKDLHNLSSNVTRNKQVETQAQKYNTAFEKWKQISELVSEASMNIFNQRMEVIKKLVSYWSQGKEVMVSEAKLVNIDNSQHADHSFQFVTTHTHSLNSDDVGSEVTLSASNYQSVNSDDVESEVTPSGSNYQSAVSEAEPANIDSSQRADHSPQFATTYTHSLNSDDVGSEVTLSARDYESANSDDVGSEVTPSDSNYESAFSGVKLPPMLKRKGRPKGRLVTVIGLPKRRKTTAGQRPLPFHRKFPQDKDKCMLSWFVSEEAIHACLHSGQLLTKADICKPHEVVHACRHSTISLTRISKYFTAKGWNAVASVMRNVQKMAWLCDACKTELNGDQICCDSCLSCMHLSCGGLRRAPKAKTWFCRSCYASVQS